MIESETSTKGYVYVLEVKDIALPVSKIGMTRRNPIERCAEINKSSTGDFIWEVAYQVAVDDCRRLESLVHNKLQPLRQRGREFFNLNAGDAYEALRSILRSQSDVNEIQDSDISVPEQAEVTTSRTSRARRTHFRESDSEYAEILQSFTVLLGIKGRPFGQLNQPEFGMSDGVEGVQWNLLISTETGEIRVGVNLEGMRYSDWPITTFILSELENPTIDKLKADLHDVDRIFVWFTRDAWQVQSRPKILERYLGGGPLRISGVDSALWAALLKEALDCLDESKGCRGRSRQEVTLANQPKKGERKRVMPVSPHLNVWTFIERTGNVRADLEAGIKRLTPVHGWLSILAGS